MAILRLPPATGTGGVTAPEIHIAVCRLAAACSLGGYRVSEEYTASILSVF
jgi:hypothetical protein